MRPKFYLLIIDFALIGCAASRPEIKHVDSNEPQGMCSWRIRESASGCIIQTDVESADRDPADPRGGLVVTSGGGRHRVDCGKSYDVCGGSVVCNCVGAPDAGPR